MIGTMIGTAIGAAVGEQAPRTSLVTNARRRPILVDDKTGPNRAAYRARTPGAQDGHQGAV
jgi:hypothetical protein